MLEWLFKKKNSNESEIDDENFTNNIDELFEYNISDQGIDVLEKWNKINNTNFTIDELLSFLQLNGFNFIDIKCVNYPLSDDIWKIPGYVGSLSFCSLINKKNALNKYSKRLLNESGENTNIRHNIHFFKDSIVLEMNYKLKVKDFRKFKITYKLESIDSKYKLNKVDEYSLVILEPSSIYANVYDCVVCERFKDENGNYVIRINERLFDDIYTKIIKFKLKDDFEFEFPSEIELMQKIGNKSVSFPENIMCILINYLKKHNIEVDDVNVEGINVQNKISRKLSYEKNDDKIQVILEKTDESDIKQVLKTIDVFLEYENNHYVRTFIIKTSDYNDMKLKIYYNNTSYNDRDFNVIDYFMAYYPIGLLDELHEWYSFDMYFSLLCDFCFSDNMDFIDMINFENYECGKLIDTKKWEKCNLDQNDTICDEPVLKRK